MLKNENKTIQTDSINRQENVLTKKIYFFLHKQKKKRIKWQRE